MKSPVSILRLLYALIFVLLICGNCAHAQTQLYTYEVKNDSIIDCTHFRFSIYLTSNTNSPAALPLRAVQGSLWIDSLFVNGGAKLSYVSGTSDIEGASIAAHYAKPAGITGSQGKGADTMIVQFNSTSIKCPGLSLKAGTTIRVAEFELTRDGSGCWGSSHAFKMAFYTSPSNGNKPQTNVSYWTTCPANAVLPAKNGTYVSGQIHERPNKK